MLLDGKRRCFLCHGRFLKRCCFSSKENRFLTRKKCSGTCGESREQGRDRLNRRSKKRLSFSASTANGHSSTTRKRCSWSVLLQNFTQREMFLLSLDIAGAMRAARHIFSLRKRWTNTCTKNAERVILEKIR